MESGVICNALDIRYARSSVRLRFAPPLLSSFKVKKNNGRFSVRVSCHFDFVKLFPARYPQV